MSGGRLGLAVGIHGKDAPEMANCPGADRRDDLVDNGLIETVEGIDDYGPVRVSFTTRGDTSPDSRPIDAGYRWIEV